MLLHPTDSGLSLAVGLQGSGKSFGMGDSYQKSARAGMDVIVVDRNCEVRTIPPDLAPLACVVPTTAVARRALRAGKRLVYVQPATSSDFEQVWDACRWAMEKRRAGLVRGVAFPEAHDFAPNEQRVLDESLSELVAKWRHRDARAWFDTQRLSMLNATLYNACFGGEVRVYAQRGPRDIDIVKQLGGAAMAAGVLKCADRFDIARRCCGKGCARCAKHRGFFVTTSPPYEPTRI